jgi:iron(III) transport system substrate-binding protein
VQVLDARSNELFQRIRTEQTANRFLGDVLFASESQTGLAIGDGVLAPLPQLPNGGLVRDKYRSKLPIATIMVVTYGILINTNLVAPGSEPKGWLDVLDPKWRGKILLDDPRSVGGGSLLFFSFDEDFHRNLAAMKPHLTLQPREAERRTALGEYAIYLPFIARNILDLKGLPVKRVDPVEGTPYVLRGASMLRNAPHPNAARLFINHYLSDEAQIVFAHNGYDPTTEGVREKLPPDVRDMLPNIKLLGTSEPARQQQMLDAAARIYS